MEEKESHYISTQHSPTDQPIIEVEEVGLENADFNTLNRERLRAYERLRRVKPGNFTKQSLGKRTRKRRAKKKAGNKTRRLART